jgi:hypothetical protein
MIMEIDEKAAEVHRLAERGEALELARLRDETATLQALLAKAARVERLMAR